MFNITKNKKWSIFIVWMLIVCMVVNTGFESMPGLSSGKVYAVGNGDITDDGSSSESTEENKKPELDGPITEEEMFEMFGDDMAGCSYEYVGTDTALQETDTYSFDDIFKAPSELELTEEELNFYATMMNSAAPLDLGDDVDDGNDSEEPLWTYDIQYVNEKDKFYVEMREDFSLKYLIQFNTHIDIEAENVIMKVKKNLFALRNGQLVEPSDLGVPMCSFDEDGNLVAVSNSASPFNYYIEKEEDGTEYLYFINYKKIDAGYKTNIEILYSDIKCYEIADETSWKIDSSIKVTLENENGEYEDQYLSSDRITALEGRVDTYANINSISKSAYKEPGVNYTPGIYTLKQLQRYINTSTIADDQNYIVNGRLNTDEYAFVLWKVTTTGECNQPWVLSFEEMPTASVMGIDAGEGKLVGVTTIRTNEYTNLRIDENNNIVKPGDTYQLNGKDVVNNTGHYLCMASASGTSYESEENKKYHNYGRSNFTVEHFVVTAYDITKEIAFTEDGEKITLKKWIDDGNGIDTLNTITGTVHPVDEKDSSTTCASNNYRNEFKQYIWGGKGGIWVDKVAAVPSDNPGARQLWGWFDVYKYNRNTLLNNPAFYEENPDELSSDINFKINTTTYNYNTTHTGVKYKDYETYTGGWAESITADDALFVRDENNFKTAIKLDESDYYYSDISIVLQDNGINVYEDEQIEPTTDDEFSTALSELSNTNITEQLEAYTATLAKVNSEGSAFRNMKIYIMRGKDVDDKDQPVDDEYVKKGWYLFDTVDWNNTGKLTYTFSKADLVKYQPYRVMVVHDTVDYATHCNINLGVHVREDSDKFVGENGYLAKAELANQNNSQFQVRLDNFCYCDVRKWNDEIVTDASLEPSRTHYSYKSYSYSYDYTEPEIANPDFDPANPSENGPANYAGYTRTEANNEIFGDYNNTYLTGGGVRDGDCYDLYAGEKEANAEKTSISKNNPAKTRVDINYSIVGYEGYKVYSQDSIQYYENTPNRFEVVIYDLLPKGVRYDGTVVPVVGRPTRLTGQDNRGNQYKFDTSYWNEAQVELVDTAITDDYNGTGRTMVAFTIRYTGAESALYDSESSRWYTGYGINFGTYITWNDLRSINKLENGFDLENLCAYMPAVNDTEDTMYGKCNSKDEVYKDDGSDLTSDKYKKYQDMYKDGKIAGNGGNGQYRVIYASYRGVQDVAIATTSTITKYIHPVDDDVLNASSTISSVGYNKPYRYTLTVSNADSETYTQDIIVFDFLEDAINRRLDIEKYQADSELFGLEKDTKIWKGTLLKVDTRALEARNIKPVVYYYFGTLIDEYIPKYDVRNTTNNQVEHSETVDKTNGTNTIKDIRLKHDAAGNGWYTSDQIPAGKTVSDAIAVAVDLTTMNNNEPFRLRRGETVDFDIYMESPTRDEVVNNFGNAEYAYNNPEYFSTQVLVSSGEYIEGSNSYQSGSSVKLSVGENEQLEIVKTIVGECPDKDKNTEFTILVTDSLLNPYINKEYQLYQFNGTDYEQIEAGIKHSTNAFGELTLKDGQKAVFANVRNANRFVITEKNNIFWAPNVEYNRDNVHDISTFTVKNTYVPVVYVRKDISGYPKDLEEGIQTNFKFQALVKNDSGNYVPYANKEYWLVNGAYTNGSVPSKINKDSAVYENGQPVYVVLNNGHYEGLVDVSLVYIATENYTQDGNRIYTCNGENYTLKGNLPVKNAEGQNAKESYQEGKLIIPDGVENHTATKVTGKAYYQDDLDSRILYTINSRGIIYYENRYQLYDVSSTLKTDSEGYFNLEVGDIAALQFEGLFGEDIRIEEEGASSANWVCSAATQDVELASPKIVKYENVYRWKDLEFEKQLLHQNPSDCTAQFKFEVVKVEANGEESHVTSDPAKGAEAGFVYHPYASYALISSGEEVYTPITDGTFAAVCAGKTIRIRGLEYGCKYIVREILEGTVADEYQVVGDGFTEVKMPTMGSSKVGDPIVNDYLYRSLEISKLVAADTIDTTKEFTLYLYKSNGQPMVNAAYTSSIKSGELKTGTNGSFTIKANEVITFKNIGKQGEAFKLSEKVDDIYKPLNLVYSVGSETNKTTIKLGEEDASFTVINGSNNYMVIRKDYIALDDVSKQYLNLDDSLIDKTPVSFKLELIDASGARFTPNVEALSHNIAKYTGSDPTPKYIGISDDNKTFEINRSDFVIVNIAKIVQSTGKIVHNYRLTEEIIPSEIDSFVADMEIADGGESVLKEYSFDVEQYDYKNGFRGTIGQDRQAVITNSLRSMPTEGRIYKAVVGKEVPKGSELVWKVQKYNAASNEWSDAAGVGYMTFDGADSPTSGVLFTGDDGLIKLKQTGIFGIYQLSVRFDRVVNIGKDNIKNPTDNTIYRVVEMKALSDDNWGYLIGYKDDIMKQFDIKNPIPEKANTFVNTQDSEEVIIEKKMDSDSKDYFTFVLDQIIGDSTIPGAGLSYTVYTSADKYVTEGTTAADGTFKLQAGQYAKITVPKYTSYKFEEKVIPMYDILKDENGNVTGLTYTKDEGDNSQVDMLNRGFRWDNDQNVPSQMLLPINFYYTGNVQEFTAPESGYYMLEAWGAQGGSVPYNGTFTGMDSFLKVVNGQKYIEGGRGGYTSGAIYLTKGQKIYVSVGGEGQYTKGNSSVYEAGGWNGGGNGYSAGSNGEHYEGGGGGATGFQLNLDTENTGILTKYSKDDIIIVAGGGGGSCNWGDKQYGIGGTGGGLTGADGFATYNSSRVGKGGTQSAGGNRKGSFGQGGAYNAGGGSAGGGGGYYGGGATDDNAGAGGGSSYINETIVVNGNTIGGGAWLYNETIQYSGWTNNPSNVPKRNDGDTWSGYVDDGDNSKIGNEGDGFARITYMPYFDGVVEGDPVSLVYDKNGEVVFAKVTSREYDTTHYDYPIDTTDFINYVANPTAADGLVLAKVSDSTHVYDVDKGIAVEVVNGDVIIPEYILTYDAKTNRYYKNQVISIHRNAIGYYKADEVGVASYNAYNSTDASANSNLTKFIMPDSIEAIGSNAFNNSTMKAGFTKFYVSNNLKYLGSKGLAFGASSYSDNNHKNSIFVMNCSPDGLLGGSYAFGSGWKLKAFNTIIIGDHFTTIGNSTSNAGTYTDFSHEFRSDWIEPRNIIYNNNITEIAANSFMNKTTISFFLPYTYDDVEYTYDEKDKDKVVGTNHEMYKFYDEETMTVNIPDKYVKSCILSGSITTVGSNAFNGCKGITGDLIIDCNVTGIGDNAFTNCAFAGTLSIGHGFRKIVQNKNDTTYYLELYQGGQYASDNKQVDIKEKYTQLSDGRYVVSAISNPKNTENVTTEVGSNVLCVDNAFGTTNSFTRLLIDGANVVTDLDNLDYYCKSCNERIYDSSFDHTGYYIDIGDKALLKFTKLKEVILGSSVRHLGDTLENPEVTNLDILGPFYKIPSINKVILSEGLETMGNACFRQCFGGAGTKPNNPSGISIPSTVQIIGRNAFQDCSNITEFEFRGAMDGSSQLHTIYGYSLSRLNLGEDENGNLKDDEGYDLVFPASVKRIGRSILKNNNGANLTKVNLIFLSKDEIIALNSGKETNYLIHEADGELKFVNRLYYFTELSIFGNLVDTNNNPSRLGLLGSEPMDNDGCDIRKWTHYIELAEQLK